MSEDNKENKPEKALKYDEGKPKLSYIPLAGLIPEAQAFTYGAKKYGKNNFKKSGMEWSRLIDACLRHVHAFNAKENNDLESGINHLGHAKACLSMLLYYMENNLGTDDR